MKKSELKQLIRETIEEVGQNAGSVRPINKTSFEVYASDSGYEREAVNYGTFKTLESAKKQAEELAADGMSVQVRQVTKLLQYSPSN